MPLPNISPRIISIIDLVLGDAVGTPLSACEKAANLTAKELQENIDYLYNNKLTSGGGPLTGITDLITQGPWIDVRYHGVDTANTAAQNDIALTAATSGMSAGSTLFFPSGTWKYSESLIFKSSYVIKGMGRGKTTLQFEGLAGTTAIQNDTAVVSTDFPHLAGFTLTNALSGDVGLDLGKCNRGIFEDLEVKSFFENNVKIDSTESSITNNNNAFYSVRSYNSLVGFELGQANQNADSNHFFGCESEDDVTPIKLVDASGCNFYAHYIDGATTCLSSFVLR